MTKSKRQITEEVYARQAAKEQAAAAERIAAHLKRVGLTEPKIIVRPDDIDRSSHRS